MTQGAARVNAMGPILCLLGVILLQAAPASAEPELILYYHERPPYTAKQADGSVHGITADIADNALKAAGIPYRWEDLPSARQLEVIKRNAGPACGVGWFKRPDREAFAKFTAAIYHDRPTIVVARADDQRFAGTPTLDALFANKKLILLTKTGYSYGGEIDAKIAADAPNLRRDPSDNVTMLGMVDRKRVDYMIMAEEEATDLLADPALGRTLAVYRLGDAPPGEYRYMMCSQSVPDALIARMNQTIVPPQ
jgi:polar amino acid transport system substrate-binding protein